ncbi:MAG: hypothetical protein HPY66_1652 [Firmicutes bacterium]|nr:hypothetical protein [Bacillota bacterium]
MANRILTAEGWTQRVRDKIGVDIAYLPDSVLEQPECITVAEANIIAQIPDYTAATGDARVYLEAAVVCECAVLLCPGMPARLPKMSQGPHARYDVDTDWTEKKKELAAERDGNVGKVREALAPGSVTTTNFFTVTHPSRRWCR